MKHLIAHISEASAALMVTFGTTITYATEYGGGGLDDGASAAGDIVGNAGIRETVIDIVKKVLTYMALAAVVVIVIAGIMMVVSGGNDESKEKAKRMILYTLIGLIIILIARGLVLIIVDL